MDDEWNEDAEEAEWVRIGSHRGTFDDGEHYLPGDTVTAPAWDGTPALWQRSLELDGWLLVAIADETGRFHAFVTPGSTGPAEADDAGRQAAAVAYTEALERIIGWGVECGFAVPLRDICHRAALRALTEPPAELRDLQPPHLTGVGRMMAMAIIGERARRSGEDW